MIDQNRMAAIKSIPDSGGVYVVHSVPAAVAIREAVKNIRPNVPIDVRVIKTTTDILPLRGIGKPIFVDYFWAEASKHSIIKALTRVPGIRQFWGSLK